MTDTRSAIVLFLCRHPRSVLSEIAEGTGIPREALRDTLERLRDAGIVTTEPAPNPSHYAYSVTPEGLTIWAREREIERAETDRAAVERLERLADRMERALRRVERPVRAPSPLAVPPDIQALCDALALKHGLPNADAATVLVAMDRALTAKERAA